MVAVVRIFLLIVALMTPMYGHGDVHERIVLLSSEIKQATQPARLLLLRAELYRMDGDYVAARADVESARRHDPLMPGIDWVTARIAQDVGTFAESRAALDRHLQRQPRDGLAWVMRGRLSEKLQDAEAAIADYTRALTFLSTPDPDVPCRLSSLLHQQGRSNDALALLATYEFPFGNVPIFLETVLLIESATGQYASALQRIDRQLQQPGRKECWLVARGDVLRQQGEEIAARLAYQAALNAITTLPASRRNTQATQDLISELNKILSNAPISSK